MARERSVYGFHAVTGQLRARPEAVRAVYLDEDRNDPRAAELAALAQTHGVALHRVDSERLDRMTGGARHQGVAAQVSRGAEARTLESILEEVTGAALLLGLDGVQDPRNLGACLRVADAFGVHAVFAPRDRAAGLTPVAAKVASGAAETVSFVPVTNLARTLRELKEDGLRVLGASAEGEGDIYSADLTGPVAWVLGGEGPGLRRLTRETCDALLRIPMVGHVESLNVAVAAGVVLGETLRQRRASRVTTP